MTLLTLFDVEEQRAFIDQGWWTGLTWPSLLERARSARPDGRALIDPRNRLDIMPGPVRSLTWDQVAHTVRSLSAALYAVGVRRGAVVAVQLPNVVELPMVMLAITRLGGIVCPFPVQYRRHELTRMCTEAGVEVFVSSGSVLGRDLTAEAVACAPHVPGLRSVVDIGELLDVTADRDSVDEYVAALDLGSADPATIVWTSGTEGFPKGVPRTHGEWEVLGTACRQSPRVTADDVLLNPFPMVNGGGLAGMFMPWLLTGCLLVQHHPFSLEVFVNEIEQHRVTYTCAPPAVLNATVADAEVAERLCSLRAVSSGSAPLAGWMIAAWESDRGVEVLNLFGSNEGGMLFAEPETVPDPGQRGRLFPRPGASGLSYRTDVARSMSAILVDLDTGEEVTEVGHPGELRLKGPAIFSGYLGRGKDGFDAQGWFCTGDIFEISAENPDLLVHVDRAKDLIIRGGYKISAAELEGLLTSDPRIVEAAAIGVTDPILGERVCAVVVLAPGAAMSLEDAIAIVRASGAAKFKWPERLVIVDALPRNAIGKVLKRDLRAHIHSPTTEDS